MSTTNEPPSWVWDEAEKLLADDRHDIGSWRRQWAALADFAGFRCWGYRSWREWAEDVEDAARPSPGKPGHGFGKA
jgi:hypothetical protein